MPTKIIAKRFVEWTCQDCGQGVTGEYNDAYQDKGRPMLIPWSDGHRCRFVLGPGEGELLKQIAEKALQEEADGAV